MIIREANKFDLPQVMNLLTDFQKGVELDLNSYGKLDLEYMNKVFHHLVLGGGVTIVAEHGDKLVGMIWAIKNPNFFFPNKTILNEILIYVVPTHRKSSACYKMLLKYKQIAENLIKDEKIINYTVSKTEQMDKIKFEKLGYYKSEEIYKGVA